MNRFVLYITWFVIAFVVVTFAYLEFVTYKNILPIPSFLVEPSVPPGVITPTSTPEPTPMSFDDMNKFYGPCVHLPVVFYHHVEDYGLARKEGHQALTVDTKIFASQMQYLKSRGYNFVAPQVLSNFFDAGTSLPTNPVMVSFDDGYSDFETDVMPIVRSLGINVIMFLPTGLVGNPNYLTWDQVESEKGSGLVYFANHSWSHANLAYSLSITTREIDTSQAQLVQHGLNPDMVLAYPYGTVGNFTISFLQERGFKLAFTTNPGSIQCKSQRLNLPRIRIGNVPLSAYGF